MLRRSFFSSIGPSLLECIFRAQNQPLQKGAASFIFRLFCPYRKKGPSLKRENHKRSGVNKSRSGRSSRGVCNFNEGQEENERSSPVVSAPASPRAAAIDRFLHLAFAKRRLVGEEPVRAKASLILLLFSPHDETRWMEVLEKQQRSISLQEVRSSGQLLFEASPFMSKAVCKTASRAGSVPVSVPRREECRT